MTAESRANEILRLWFTWSEEEHRAKLKSFRDAAAVDDDVFDSNPGLLRLFASLDDENARAVLQWYSALNAIMKYEMWDILSKIDNLAPAFPTCAYLFFPLEKKLYDAIKPRARDDDVGRGIKKSPMGADVEKFREEFRLYRSFCDTFIAYWMRKHREPEFQRAIVHFARNKETWATMTDSPELCVEMAKGGYFGAAIPYPDDRTEFRAHVRGSVSRITRAVIERKTQLVARMFQEGDALATCLEKRMWTVLADRSVPTVPGMVASLEFARVWFARDKRVYDALRRHAPNPIHPFVRGDTRVALKRAAFDVGSVPNAERLLVEWYKAFEIHKDDYAPRARIIKDFLGSERNRVAMRAMPIFMEMLVDLETDAEIFRALDSPLLGETLRTAEEEYIRVQFQFLPQGFGTPDDLTTLRLARESRGPIYWELESRSGSEEYRNFAEFHEAVGLFDVRDDVYATRGVSSDVAARIFERHSMPEFVARAMYAPDRTWWSAVSARADARLMDEGRGTLLTLARSMSHENEARDQVSALERFGVRPGETPTPERTLKTEAALRFFARGRPLRAQRAALADFSSVEARRYLETKEAFYRFLYAARRDPSTMFDESDVALSLAFAEPGMRKTVWSFLVARRNELRT